MSDSVVLELSVADFCLSTASVRNSFLRAFLQSFASFASPLVMFFDVSVFFHGFSASV